jgi:site-specific DNA-cytosine methylase
LNSMARQIGNAVPVVLAKTLGDAFRKHYRRRRRQPAVLRR